MIQRPVYLNRLISLKDKELIKVVTGIRRCGKSTLFDLFIGYLKENGVDDEQIIHINFEDTDFDYITDYKKLHEYIKSKLIPDRKNYIFFDEIQKVKDFQKECDSLYIKKNVDLYITGSNADILSGELATLLSGRYVEIKMLPLSFKEYISYRGESDLAIKFKEYLTNGSFPYTLNLESKNDKRSYLEGIFNTIVIKDIVQRKKINDIANLNMIIKFIFDNIGNLVSSTKIANSMTSGGHKISVPTVENYLRALEEAYILHRVERYDIKGKQYLSSGVKYYLTDIGLRYFLLGSKDTDEGHILENIVYLELIRRGYEVYIGKVGNKEVDFIAINEYGEEYYQVSETVRGKETLERELYSLNSINDHNAKYLLTMDFLPYTSHNGIKQINILEWLLEK